MFVILLVRLYLFNRWYYFCYWDYTCCWDNICCLIGEIIFVWSVRIYLYCICISVRLYSLLRLYLFNWWEYICLIGENIFVKLVRLYFFDWWEYICFIGENIFVWLVRLYLFKRWDYICNSLVFANRPLWKGQGLAPLGDKTNDDDVLRQKPTILILGLYISLRVLQGSCSPSAYMTVAINAVK